MTVAAAGKTGIIAVFLFHRSRPLHAKRPSGLRQPSLGADPCPLGRYATPTRGRYEHPACASHPWETIPARSVGTPSMATNLRRLRTSAATNSRTERPSGLRQPRTGAGASALLSCVRCNCFLRRLARQANREPAVAPNSKYASQVGRQCRPGGVSEAETWMS